ncbi:MAG TPA: ring-cleaving dioxygenase [Thermoanaerobaculia bacterium]|nr:ring-cleaving dioxygenase [Thermoanaerobaculia bacterium]
MVTARARPGTGQISATRFWIPASSRDFWVDRLAAAAVDFWGPEERFGESVVSLVDPDGLPLELVAREGGAPREPWAQGPVPVEHQIRGFAGATLCLNGYEHTAELLTATMGLRELAAEGSRFRFRVGDGQDAATIDLHCRPETEPGRMGIGAAHHIAWRTTSREAQLEWRRVLAKAGMDLTPVLDRNYFESIYFREPGGVLFEIATDSPGFTVDESPTELGTHLTLPPWLEPRRQALAARLPELRLPADLAVTKSLQ